MQSSHSEKGQKHSSVEGAGTDSLLLEKVGKGTYSLSLRERAGVRGLKHP
jgi:hypothetical protein